MNLSSKINFAKFIAGQFATRIGFLKLFRITPRLRKQFCGDTLVVYSKVRVKTSNVLFESLILAQGERW